jgi:hypothetical protein
MNLTPSKLVDTSDLEINTVVHELMHVLGFTSSQFYKCGCGVCVSACCTQASLRVVSSYIDATTGRLYDRTQIIQHGMLANGKVSERVCVCARASNGSDRVCAQPTISIATPSLLTFAAQHYNCSSISAVELEDQDGLDPPSHWEKRVLGNELMTAVISDIDAALSGVYVYVYERCDRAVIMRLCRIHFVGVARFGMVRVMHLAGSW